MKIISHILDLDAKCSRCGKNMKGIPLQPPTPKGEQLVVGDRIGIISDLRFSGESAYLITALDFDSNPLCAA